jgi:DNA transformation protein and related proteins
MDAERLKALFGPFGPVTVRRMFGGAGICAEGLCFAIESNGEVFLKADALSQPNFSAAGSAPFAHEMKGKPKSMSYWRLLEIAHDEADELRRWAGMGLEAARRAAEAKGDRKRKPTLLAKKPGEVVRGMRCAYGLRSDDAVRSIKLAAP